MAVEPKEGPQPPPFELFEREPSAGTAGSLGDFITSLPQSMSRLGALQHQQLTKMFRDLRQDILSSRLDVLDALSMKGQGQLVSPGAQGYQEVYPQRWQRDLLEMKQMLISIEQDVHSLKSHGLGVPAKRPQEAADSSTTFHQKDIRNAASPSKKEDQVPTAFKEDNSDKRLGSLASHGHLYAQKTKDLSLRLLDKATVWYEWWMSIREPERESCVTTIVSSFQFQALTLIIILTNTIFIAVDANNEMETGSDDGQEFLHTAENVFLAYYALEILLKIVAHGVYFFVGEDMLWNLFDLLVVITSFMDMLLSMSANMAFMRTLRVLRVSKALRVFRVISFLRDLRVMLACILGSFLPLFWCMVLLLLIGVIFAIFYVQSLAAYLREADDVSDFVRHNVHYYFGSVHQALLTLYKIITGMIEGDDVYQVVELTGWVNAAILLGLIGFYQISVINILSGIFLEKALEHAKPEREREIMQRRQEVVAKIANLKALCHKIPLAEPGIIRKEEFMNALRDPEIAYEFETDDLDIRDAEAFFDILGRVGGSDYVDIDTFVASCMRMRGPATSIDLAHLELLTRKSYADITAQVRPNHKGF